MMKSPSVAAMTRTFRDLSAEQAGLIKRICRAVDDGNALESLLRAEVPSVCEETFAGQIATANRSWRRTYALRAVDVILGTHGVEDIGGAGDDVYSGPAYEYLNTGDTYAATLVYVKASDTLTIDSMGDIVERKDL